MVCIASRCEIHRVGIFRVDWTQSLAVGHSGNYAWNYAQNCVANIHISWSLFFGIPYWIASSIYWFLSLSFFVEGLFHRTNVYVHHILSIVTVCACIPRDIWECAWDLLQLGLNLQSDRLFSLTVVDRKIIVQLQPSHRCQWSFLHLGHCRAFQRQLCEGIAGNTAEIIGWTDMRWEKDNV